jgi:hypothetical protein
MTLGGRVAGKVGGGVGGKEGGGIGGREAKVGGGLDFERRRFDQNHDSTCTSDP